MTKKYLLLLALAKASSLYAVVTLDASWPVIAENLPVTLNRMQEFKSDCLAYMAGLNPNKPMVYPNCSEWVDWHTNLFRLYAISLEGLLVNFLQTFGGDEFVYGNNLVELFNSMEAASELEMNDASYSISLLEDQIQDAESTKATAQFAMQQRLLQWVDAKLAISNGVTPAPDLATIESDIDGMIVTIRTAQTDVEQKTYIKNTAWVQGIRTEWADAQLAAQNTLLSEADVQLNTAITANLSDQKVLVLKLENIAFALSRVQTLSTEPTPVYQASVYQALNDELHATQTSLTAALTQKRIDMDEGLLGGTYNPDDYANPVVSNYVPQQIKFISFPAFKSCWDATNYGLASQETLDARNLDDGIVAII